MARPRVAWAMRHDFDNTEQLVASSEKLLAGSRASLRHSQFLIARSRAAIARSYSISAAARPWWRMLADRAVHRAHDA